MFASAEVQELGVAQWGRKGSRGGDLVRLGRQRGYNESSWTLVTDWIEVKCRFHSGLACSSSGKSGTISEPVSPFVKEG